MSGANTALAETGIVGSAFANPSSSQTTANLMGSPNTASTSPVLANNTNIANAFGSAPTFFGSAASGGAYSGSAAGTHADRDEHGQPHRRPHATQRRARPHPRFYSPTSSGNGFQNLNLNVVENGTSVLTQSFNSLSAASAYFTNDAVDLGSLAASATR